MSPSTKEKDLSDNLELYAKVFRTREYFWYDEEAGEWAGYRLEGDRYAPIEPNEQGWRWSEVLGAWFGVSDAPYRGWRYRWLRLYDREGRLIPTGDERAEQERLRAEAERQRAEQERQQREQLQQRLAALEAELKKLRGEA